MDKSWRPKGWENPYERPVRSGVMWTAELLTANVIDSYEAGADAILEALKDDGVHFETGEWTDDATFEVEEPGTVVFIPDKD